MALEKQLYDNASGATCPLYYEQGEQESRAYLHLCIEGDGSLWVGSNAPSDNTSTFRQHYGVERRYRIPNNLTERGYNEIMSDPKILALCERIVAGGSVVFDGSNHVAELTADAVGADDDLERYCEAIEFQDYDYLEAGSAAFYLDGEKASAIVAGGSIEDAAERVFQNALSERRYLSRTDIEKTLERMLEWEQED